MNDTIPKIGCCGWRLTKPRYAEEFPVVEVQQTFYEPPMIGTLKRWRASVPADFEFTLKAWQLITHRSTSPTYRRLKTMLRPDEAADCGSFQSTAIVEQAWSATRACAEALGARLVLFQCPASFTPTLSNLEQMRSFFTRIKRDGLQLLWEPRGEWPESLIKSLCEELDLIHAVDPMITRTVTPEFIYFRLHGGKDFKGIHSDTQLRDLKELVGTDKPAYVMFNNINMLDDATRFRDLMQPLRFSRNLEFKWAFDRTGNTRPRPN